MMSASRSHHISSFPLEAIERTPDFYARHITNSHSLASSNFPESERGGCVVYIRDDSAELNTREGQDSAGRRELTLRFALETNPTSELQRLRNSLLVCP